MQQVKTESARIRERLSHPVIDGDGHTVEFLPVVLDYMRDLGGSKLVDGFMARVPAFIRQYFLDDGSVQTPAPVSWHIMSPEERRKGRVYNPGFWNFPTGNALDRATVMLPKLLRERLDELGIDFTVVYTSIGLVVMAIPDEDIRRVGCRALNTMYAETFGPHADRITVPAAIPMFTPEEAIDELEFAVNKLGMKAVTLGTHVRRTSQRQGGITTHSPFQTNVTTWVDPIVLDSEFDYDPVWAKCLELKVAPTVHSPGMGVGSRTTSNYVFNHVGHFAAANEAFCKGLVLSGVVDRFPALRFAFLEGGVGWACNLYNDLVEHWEIRNVDYLQRNLNPAILDRAKLGELLDRYGEKRFHGRLNDHLSREAYPPAEDLDDWRALNLKIPHKLADIFGRFFFGCESEDRMTAVAFNSRLNHFGIKLQPVFSSDMGHFDVIDITKVLASAYELVEDNLLTEDQFRDFTFTNAVKLYTSMNPDFFKGTVIEDSANKAMAVGLT